MANRLAFALLMWYNRKTMFNEVRKVIDISTWMHEFTQVLEKTFGNRVWFVGLQGSYGRGEATETSDIDVVVILDELSPADILTYRKMLDGLSPRELICGFLAGKQELLAWETSDLFQFCHDTTPIKGSFEELFALIDRDAVRRAIKIGACNLYHGCVHNMVHGQSEEVLRGLYKGASFVLQAICYLQTGEYVRRHADWLELLSPEDRQIGETFAYLKRGGEVEFAKMSEAMFAWCQKRIGG